MTDQPKTSVQIRLGTRNSPLAMAQAYETRERLCAAPGWSTNAVELVPVVASGAKVLARPLAEIGGKALWTKELDVWLDEGRIDVAVHSAKDVETERPDAFVFGAVLPRADRRDCLVGASSIAAIPKGAVVGTSAPRRAAQLLNVRPDCSVVTFRGNVATRLAKLKAGEADVTFLAAAGLDRLDQSEVGSPLDTDEWIPAAAQGAIALECRAGDDKTLATLADTSMVIGCGGAAGEMIPVGTVTLDTQFLRPASGDAIEAHAEITRLGRSMVFARCTLTALPSGKPVALATATFAR